MNLRKKIQGFFTLTRKANGGFTLVELIVVIAILAILAGVAVPAYSGYINKANEAADQQLLADINMAFATACAMNGESHIGRKQIDSPKLADSSGKLTVQFNHTDEFETFFESENAEFKFYEISQIMYNDAAGTFGLTAGKVISYLGKNFVVFDTDRDAMLYSVFGDSTKFPAGTLVNEVDSVVEFAAGKVSSNALLANLVTADPYKDVFKNIFGVDVSDPSVTDDQKMSALVVYTAQNSKNLSAQDMLNTLKEGTGQMGDYLGSNENSIAGDTEDATKIAMHYAVAMAWAQEAGKTYSTPDELFDLLGVHTDAPSFENNYNPQPKNEFKDWLNTDEGAATALSAMNGYLGAMNIIANNAGNVKGEDLTDGSGNFVGFDNYADLIEDVLRQD